MIILAQSPVQRKGWNDHAIFKTCDVPLYWKEQPHRVRQNNVNTHLNDFDR